MSVMPIVSSSIDLVRAILVDARMGIHFVAGIDIHDPVKLDIDSSTLCFVVHVRSNCGGIMEVSDSFTQDFDVGFWIAESKMSRMRICSLGSSAAVVLEGCRLGKTVGIHSVATKCSDVHIALPSALALVVSFRESLTPASANDSKLGDVVIDVDGVEIADLMASAVAAAAPIAPPG